jgi:lactate dehydrogenase-like 2-hydroxyacid dehydrogenase
VSLDEEPDLTASRIPVLAAAKLSPLYQAPLAAEFDLLDRLQETDPAAFTRLAPTIRAIAGQGETRVSAELIAACPKLEVVAIMGVGYDGVDVAAARSRGVMVTHTPDVLNDDVADLAIALMLGAARRLAEADAHVRRGDWAARGPMPLARKMSGARLGLLGMGRIGQAIAHRALAFGMQVAYHARSPRTQLPYAYAASPRELAAGCDFLVVITPGGAATLHMVNAEVLAALGKGRGEGILVNVARGSVVDEAALVDALQRGVIAGAGLDVFEAEPQVPAALRAMPQVMLTPHIGSATASTRQAMADLALANLRACLAGRPPLTPVPECR